MKVQSVQEYPKPKLYQINIEGLFQNGSTQTLSVIQLVADPIDLNNTIQCLTEDYVSYEFKTVELHVGLSPYCHEVFIKGTEAMENE